MGSDDLHGSAPDSHRTALLLIDVINPFDFPEADQLLELALPAARRIAALTGRARQVVLTGLAGNICVLFTANDAYMRDLELFVPEDCCASNTRHDNEHALRQMGTLLKAQTAPSGTLRFTKDGVRVDAR
uniref:Isochorismatase n=1 Tax=Simulacricoccus ruber TaxID=2303410 RepID=A0A3Q8I223_9BACT|nr:isochorismatase [Simulacricoccus ruber]